MIAPPLRGKWWIDLNGCCADTTALHRSVVTTANGTYVTPEMFAIDWVQVVHGALFRGNGKQLSDWFSFGKPIYAVANGVVVGPSTTAPRRPRSPTPPPCRSPRITSAMRS